MRERICHLTTVHRVFDVRIFRKQAKALAEAGYNVTLIAQHDRHETVDGIKIVSLPRPKNRFQRIFVTTWQAFCLALRQRARVYHFHDPELLPVGVLLKLLTHAKVVYDVHEDYSQAIRTKYWISKPWRAILARLFHFIEQLASRSLDAIVSVTEAIQSHFPAQKTVLVKNYPILEFAGIPRRHPSQRNSLVLIYVGGLIRLRGIYELVQALELLNSHWDVRLELLGQFIEPTFEQKVRALKGFQQVQFCGWVPYREVFLHLQRADIGFVLFHPVPNHMEALPTKLFEYMSAGLPVIVSHFPLWREIVEGNQCGVTVNPLDPQDIASAIEYLWQRPELRCRMGQSGRQAVQAKYNWEVEAKKLTELYEKLLSPRGERSS